MELILEIRDGCTTPSQLLRSLAFARYLKIYKEVFIGDMNILINRDKLKVVVACTQLMARMGKSENGGKNGSYITPATGLKRCP